MLAVEKRAESLERQMAELREEIGQVHERIDGLGTQVDFLAGKVEALEVRIEDQEKRNEKQHQELFSRFSTMDSDLKTFASLVNETVLHYAEEMDTVRDRLDNIETKSGITFRSD
jgi:SMC interacting uncharacterized protein involved in chromosome segregation